MKIFGQRLKELRIERKISTRSLGKIIGVESSTISRWESDQIEIIAPHLAKLAKYFGVTTDFLLGLED
jgi:transcriptional regulator with XRE-family HTH domain